MQLVYDPEADEMRMVPCSIGALCTLLGSLYYRPLGPKQPELEDVDRAPEGLKQAFQKNHAQVNKVYPRSVFKKQYTALVFWPYAPPGEITINTDLNMAEKFEGLRYEFMQANGIVTSKKTAIDKATFPSMFFFNQWRGFRYYSHPFHHTPRFNLEWSRLVLGRLQCYLLEIVCNGNKIHYDYFSRWMAWIRQHPDIKTNVVPIMVPDFVCFLFFGIK